MPHNGCSIQVDFTCAQFFHSSLAQNLSGIYYRYRKDAKIELLGFFSDGNKMKYVIHTSNIELIFVLKCFFMCRNMLIFSHPDIRKISNIRD